MEQLFTWDVATMGAGMVALAIVWLYTHFSHASATEQQLRVQTVGTFISYAYHALAEVAAKTNATWDDRVASILGRVDQVLRAQGEATLDPGEQEKAKLQIAALAGAQKTGALVASASPPTPR